MITLRGIKPDVDVKSSNHSGYICFPVRWATIKQRILPVGIHNRLPTALRPPLAASEGAGATSEKVPSSGRAFKPFRIFIKTWWFLFLFLYFSFSFLMITFDVFFGDIFWWFPVMISFGDSLCGFLSMNSCDDSTSTFGRQQPQKAHPVGSREFMEFPFSPPFAGHMPRGPRGLYDVIRSNGPI